MTLLVKRALYVIALFAWAEVSSFISLKILAHRMPNAVFESKGIFDRNLIALNLADPLGWGSSNIKTSTLGSNPKCSVSLFGDSYLESSIYKEFNLDGKQLSFEDHLASLTGCKIKNYAVGGYGSDQAYLKLKSVAARNNLRGEIVILGHLSENILRNSNRNRSLLYPNGLHSTPLLKPVFFLDEEKKIKLLTLPKELSEKDLLQIRQLGISDRTEPGEDIRFIPGRSWQSPALIKAPYSLRLANIIRSWHIRPRFFGKPRYAEFYKDGASSLIVTKQILSSFHGLCKAKGCISISIDLPTASDFPYYFNSEQDQFPLTRAMKEEGLNHISFGSFISSKKSGLVDNICTIYDGNADGGDPCNGHLNSEGYRILTSYLADKIIAVKSSRRSLIADTGASQ